MKIIHTFIISSINSFHFINFFLFLLLFSIVAVMKMDCSALLLRGSWLTHGPRWCLCGCTTIGDPISSLRLLPANGWAPQGYKFRPTHARRGLIWWAVLAWGLAISLAKTFLELCCSPRLFLLNPSISSPSRVWPTSWSEGSPYLLLLPTLSFTGICSNPILGSSSQQIKPNTFLLILIFLFSLFHLPPFPPSPPLVLLWSSSGCLMCLPLLGYLWNLLSRDIGNQTVYGMEPGLITE